jgi:hypothetical protein
MLAGVLASCACALLASLACSPDRVFSTADGGAGPGGATTTNGSSGDSSSGTGGSSGGETSGASNGNTSTCPDAGAPCAATCPGCFIDSECVTAGAENPDNGCEICNPDAADTGWSSNEGRSCDDGLYCTVNDECDDGSCNGKSRECDDDVACNGEERCDEEADECTTGEVQCEGSFCDLERDECVTSCAGCVMDNLCVTEGAESRSNPCLVCDPDVSEAGYSAAVGKACGNGPEICSEQDTCDASGTCQANHQGAGSDCGSGGSGACDRADTCDGAGQCATNSVANGTDCDDGAYCSTASECQGGECVTVASRGCPTHQRCDEGTESCLCDGCQIGSTCVPEEALNPSDECEICAASRSRTDYSPNTGASCGDEATDCSEQDTCSASGVCEPNDLADTSECPGGLCEAGVCEITSNPFDCVAVDPPAAPYPEVLTLPNPPPNMQGGGIPDGRYVPTRIDLYGAASTIDVRAFEFRSNYVQVSSRSYAYPAGTASTPEIQFSGSYTTSSDLLTFNLTRCDPEYIINVPNVWYTPTMSGLTTVVLLPNGTPMVTIYSKE